MMIFKKITAMTLVEVIVAIIVFGVGILVILRMVTVNIGWIYDIRNKDTALSIAKEGIDIVYHIRDSNLERGALWDCARIDLNADNACGGFFYEGGDSTKHIITFEPDEMYSMEAYVSTGDSVIYYHTGMIDVSGISGLVEAFWYNHTQEGGTETQFQRFIEFKPVVGYEANTGSVLQVISSVSYGRNNAQKIVLESIVGNIR